MVVLSPTDGWPNLEKATYSTSKNPLFYCVRKVLRFAIRAFLAIGTTCIGLYVLDSKAALDANQMPTTCETLRVPPMTRQASYPICKHRRFQFLDGHVIRHAVRAHEDRSRSGLLPTEF